MISQAIHASIKKEFFLSVKKLAVLLSFFVRQCCHVAYFFRAIYKLIFSFDASLWFVPTACLRPFRFFNPPQFTRSLFIATCQVDDVERFSFLFFF